MLTQISAWSHAWSSSNELPRIFSLHPDRVLYSMRQLPGVRVKTRSLSRPSGTILCRCQSSIYRRTMITGRVIL